MSDKKLLSDFNDSIRYAELLSSGEIERLVAVQDILVKTIRRILGGSDE